MTVSVGLSTAHTAKPSENIANEIRLRCSHFPHLARGLRRKDEPRLLVLLPTSLSSARNRRTGSVDTWILGSDHVRSVLHGRMAVHRMDIWHSLNSLSPNSRVPLPRLHLLLPQLHLLLLPNNTTLNTSEILGSAPDVLCLLRTVLQLGQHGPNLQFRVQVGTCPFVAEVSEPAQSAVFDAGEFERTLAFGVVAFARQAGRLRVVLVAFAHWCASSGWRSGDAIRYRARELGTLKLSSCGRLVHVNASVSQGSGTCFLGGVRWLCAFMSSTFSIGRGALRSHHTARRTGLCIL